MLWGQDSYQFVTNSLGFRDDKIRDVPLASSKPRILLLGDSFAEGELGWADSFAGRIAYARPQYDFLNGGVSGYSPSNYLNVTRQLLNDGFDIDEVIVFIDATAAHYEAAYYHDINDSGAVGGPKAERRNSSWYGRWRARISSHLLATSDILNFVDQRLVPAGYYHLPIWLTASNLFDVEWAAWPYRGVDETDPFPAGYAPLGLKTGLAKETAKMTQLWQELEKRNIPISVVVYPYPSQLVHDNVNSQQVQIWQQWCQDKCKRFVSLYPVFFAAKEQCPRLQPGCWYAKLFIFGDIHYSDAGNALVADAVVKSLTNTPPAKLAGALPANVN